MSMIVSGLIGAAISWGLNWFLPMKPVIAENMPSKELTCILDYSQKLLSQNTNDELLKITYNGIEVIRHYK